jgi:hypothetical protein
VKLEMTAEDRCGQYAYSLDEVLPLVAAAEYVRDVVEAATVHGLDGQHVSIPRVMEHHRSVDSYNAHDSSFCVRFQAANALTRVRAPRSGLVKITCDALGFTTSGVARGGRERDGDPSVACARHPALEGGDVQVLHRVAKVTGLCKPRRRREASGSDRQMVAHSWVSNSFLRAPFFSSGFVQMVDAGGVASWRCQREK